MTARPLHILFVIPGDINTPSGGYGYDRAMIAGWRASGLCVTLLSLPGPYPFPGSGDLEEATRLLKKVATPDIAIVDGLAGGCAPSLLELLSTQSPVVSLIHHPLCLEIGLTADQAQTLEQSEQQGLAFVKGVVTTSPTTSRTVADLFSFPTERIFIVIPGVERGTMAGGGKTDTLNLLSIGSISPRKGHDVLIKALSPLKDLKWSLKIVGNDEATPGLANELKALATEEGLDDRIAFLGALPAERLNALYEEADLFTLASRYEGYGMVFSEAIVRGLPVVSTKAGAIRETVPQTCGLLSDPDDVDAFSAHLRRMMTDHGLREEKRAGCLAAASSFPTWQQSADHFQTFLEDLI